MTACEENLRQALQEFMLAAQRRDTATVSATLKRVTELETLLGPDASPMLRHYLERRSYQKALDFLNSGRPETETPQCGH